MNIIAIDVLLKISNCSPITSSQFEYRDIVLGSERQREPQVDAMEDGVTEYWEV